MSRHHASVVTLCAAALLSAVGCASHRSDWTPLFDGKTLDGWVRRGGEATYRVEDGAIVGATVPNTANTFLCTQREFTDFILELDFKVDPKLNSGVQIRSQSLSAYQKGRVHGYQVEIDPSEWAYTAGIYDEARRGVFLQDLAQNEPARNAFKQNEWNHIRVECRGESIKTWLNGVPAADMTDSLTRTGFIGLQVHTTDSKTPLEVRWRNLRIKDLGDRWSKPPAGGVVLLGSNGDLSAWEHFGKPGSKIEWTWADGALQVKPGSGNIVTKQKFGDCGLHVEFNVDDNGKEGQANGNSGVYLQQRYEVQILNSAGQELKDDICGAIYRVKAADVNMARPAGQWQTYDIEFHAPRWEGEKKVESARITVYHNGTRVHENVEVPHATGAGQPEGPGDAPLLLQDHGNNIRFRNIWIAPLEAHARATLEPDFAHPDIPLVMFHRFPNFAPGQKMISGPVVAVWPGGRIVRVSSEGAIGESYVDGRLSTSEMHALLAFIADRPQLLAPRRDQVIPDAAWEEMGIRTRKARMSRGEALRQQTEDEEVTALRTLLMSLEIPDAKPTTAPWQSPPKDWYRS